MKRLIAISLMSFVTLIAAGCHAATQSTSGVQLKPLETAQDPSVTVAPDTSGSPYRGRVPVELAPPAEVDCNPAGYVGRKVLRPGEKKKPGSPDIDPADYKSGAIRIFKPGDAATSDYSPTRLNLIIDPKTNIVKEASCG